MSDTIIGLDQTEEEMLAYEVSEEALETAAGTGSEKSGELHALVLHGFKSLPGPENRKPRAYFGHSWLC